MKVIAFDLHDVVFYMDYKKVASIVWHTYPKLPLITTSLHPRFWINFAKLIHKNAVGEEYVMRMAQWHPTLKPYIPTGIEIINAQIPNQAVVNIIDDLKKNGHHIIAFSNIGEHAFADLCGQFPEVMNLFDNTIHTSITDDYIRKPMPTAFEKLINKVDCASKDILFIDNKRKNITAAQRFNINAILYQSPETLHMHLKELITL